MFSGAFTSASLLCLSGKYQEAEKAIITAININDYANYNVGIYTTYANILSALGKNSKAEEYYRKALLHIDNQEISSIVDSYLNYGGFLIKNRRYRQAVEILKKGLELSLSSKNAVNRYSLYLNLSDAYKHLGRPDSNDDSYDYTITYEYDSMGNWIKAVKTQNGEETVIERTITYW